MREVKYGQIVGPQMRRVALCLNGQEIAVGSVEDWPQAVEWGKETWDKLRAEFEAGVLDASFSDSAYDLYSSGNKEPELRYWL